MGWTYAWESEHVGRVSANYATREDAERQATYDAGVCGGAAPRHILDHDGVVVAAFKDSSTFEVIEPRTVIVKGAERVDLQVVDTKTAPADGDSGQLLVTQVALEGDALAAYAKAYVEERAAATRE